MTGAGGARVEWVRSGWATSLSREGHKGKRQGLEERSWG